MNKIFTYTTLIFCFLSFSSCFGGSARNDKSEKELSYEGIVFNYPRSWKVTTEELGEGSFYVKAKNSDNLYVMSFLTMECDQEKMISSYLESIQESEIRVTVTQNIQKGTFGKYECLQATYEMSYLGNKLYGIVSSFYSNGITVLTVKQADTKGRLKRNFKTIENSLDVQGTDEITEEIVEG